MNGSSMYQQLDNKMLHIVSLMNQTTQLHKQNLTNSIKNLDQIIKINYNHGIKRSLRNQMYLNRLKKVSNVILKNLEKINLIKENIKNRVFTYKNDIQQQKKVIKYENQQIQLEQYLVMNQQIELKLIDDSNEQSNCSCANVFDKTVSIMVSSDNSKIIIWNFQNERLNISKTDQMHANQCVVYSQQSNNFSYDNVVIRWQQINEKEWKYSQPFQQHKNDVICLILNKKENQFISGGIDQSIKVWKVDFIKNGLTFLYSLDRYSKIVGTISLNKSETVMTSYGFHEFIIWEKGLYQKWEFNKQLNKMSIYISY